MTYLICRNCKAILSMSGIFFEPRSICPMCLSENTDKYMELKFSSFSTTTDCKEQSIGSTPKINSVHK